MIAEFEWVSASFEFGDRQPQAISRCQYLLVNQANGVCSQLLCSQDGLLGFVDEAILAQLKSSCTIVADEYLGLAGDCAFRVLIVKDAAAPAGWIWAGLRNQLNQLPATLFALGGRALQIAQWLADHQFCGRCGRATGGDSLDRARVCSHCEVRFYPRISPGMIVLVRRGRELLLARHLRASRPVYSTLAGFVEAGETVEQCVHREVKEEVGVTLAKLEYVKSQ